MGKTQNRRVGRPRGSLNKKGTKAHPFVPKPVEIPEEVVVVPTLTVTEADMRAFFIKMTGLEPTPDQLRLLMDLISPAYSLIEISSGRQSGKTLTSAVAVMWFVFEYPETLNLLLISAQDNIIYFHMRNMFRRNPELWSQLTDRSQMAKDMVPIRGFETKRGSVVFIKNATDKGIRGTPANIVFIDEACKVSNENILTAVGCVTKGAKISKVVMLTTPDEDKSYFVIWYYQEKTPWKIFQWSAEGLPWHDPVIEKLKKDEFSTEKYATEVLGRPKTPEERAFFPRVHIDKCIFEIECIREGGATSTVEAGIDFGFYSPTVLTLTERITSTKRKILFVKEWVEQPIELYGREIADILENYHVSVVKVDSRPPEYKGQLEKFTRKHITYIDGACGHKEQMLGQLQRMVREERLIIPIQFVATVKQLQIYKRRMVRGDDYVDSLALSIYEPPEGTGNTHSGVVVFSPNNDGYGNQRGNS